MSYANEMSPADIRACTCNDNGNCNDGFGFGGNGIVALIALLIVGSMFGGFGGLGGFGGGGILPWLLFNGGGNFGSFGGNAQQAYNVEAVVQRGFDNQSVINKLNGLEDGLCDIGYNSAQLANNAMMQMSNEFRGIDNQISQASFNAQQGLNNLGQIVTNQGYESRIAVQGVQNQMSGCCCDLKEAIKDSITQNVMNTNAIQQSVQSIGREAEKIAMQSRFDAAQNNCATLQAIDKLGDRIEARLTAQELAAKDATIAALNQQNFAYQLKASQSEQTNQLQQYVNGQFVYYNPRPVPSFNVPAQYPYCMPVSQRTLTPLCKRSLQLRYGG